MSRQRIAWAALPAGKSHGAVAADFGVSRSAVGRILRRQAAEVAAGNFRQSAEMHHRQPLRPRFVAAAVRAFLRLRPAKRAAAAEGINAAVAASTSEGD